jgi:hypothetical protein
MVPVSDVSGLEDDVGSESYWKAKLKVAEVEVSDAQVTVGEAIAVEPTFPDSATAKSVESALYEL